MVIGSRRIGMPEIGFMDRRIKLFFRSIPRKTDTKIVTKTSWGMETTKMLLSGLCGALSSPQRLW